MANHFVKLCKFKRILKMIYIINLNDVKINCITYPNRTFRQCDITMMPKRFQKSQSYRLLKYDFVI